MSTPKVCAGRFRQRDAARNAGVSSIRDEGGEQSADGQWLADSEEPVRELSADFRRQAYEKAVQMRVDAAEAAFPPSTQHGDGQASGE